MPTRTLLDGHDLLLLQGGGEYFQNLIEAIDGAQHVVRLETYIFDFDEAHGIASIAVARALVHAAQRGVVVQLLMDGAGTGTVPVYWQGEFKQSGVQWRIYSPFGLSGYFSPSSWRRLHRKLCAVDPGTPEAVAFCGGINVLDDFFDPNHGVLERPRFDFAVQVRGPMAAHIAGATQHTWDLAQMGTQMRRAPVAIATIAMRVGKSGVLKRLKSTEATTRRGSAVLLLRDNLLNRSSIERAYRKAIGEAHHEIVIANAYFLPGGKLRRALVSASERGVKVVLLLQGRYEYFMQWHAARPIYDGLLAAGIEIHAYEVSFLHAKVAVIDAHGDRPWVTVGSSNLDPLSLLMAREANVVVEDAAFAKDLRARLQTAIDNEGEQLLPSQFGKRSLWQRSLDWLAYGTMRAVLWLMGQRY